MKPSKAWKALERRVSEFFGGSGRTPLSGINSKHTGADVIHPKLFIEVKQRACPAIWTLWEKTKAFAIKENKTPVVCVQKKNCSGFLVVVHCNDLTKLNW